MHSVWMKESMMTCLNPSAMWNAFIGRWPLLKLSGLVNALSAYNVTARPSSPLEFSKFNVYNSDVISLRHLLPRLLRTFAECFLDQIISVLTLRLHHHSLKESLNLVGIERQKESFNCKEKYVHSFRVSTRYSILLILVTAIQTKGIYGKARCKKVVSLLEEISYLLYPWLVTPIEGANFVQFIHGRNQFLYHWTIFRLAQEYLQDIKELCTHPPFWKHT